MPRIGQRMRMPSEVSQRHREAYLEGCRRLPNGGIGIGPTRCQEWPSLDAWNGYVMPGIGLSVPWKVMPPILSVWVDRGLDDRALVMGSDLVKRMQLGNGMSTCIPMGGIQRYRIQVLGSGNGDVPGAGQFRRCVCARMMVRVLIRSCVVMGMQMDRYRLESPGCG